MGTFILTMYETRIKAHVFSFCSIIIVMLPLMIFFGALIFCFQVGRYFSLRNALGRMETFYDDKISDDDFKSTCQTESLFILKRGGWTGI